MLKKTLSVFLIAILYAGISYQALAQRGPYPGSGRAFTRDEMGEITASGGSVAKGLVAYIDSTDTLRTATWSTDYLNQAIIGISTGSFRKLRTIGVMDVGNCTDIGASYWLGPGGTLIDTIPKKQNVWIIKVGRCVETDKILLDSPIIAIRREGDE